MKIERATLLLDSSHDSFRREYAEESLRASGADASGVSTEVVLVTISQAARSTLERELSATKDRLAPAAVTEVDHGADPVDDDPMLALVKAMVELLTGRPVKTFSASDLELPAGQAVRAPADWRPPVSVYRKRVSEDHEATRFVARGLVRTADGRDLKFELQMEMERHFRAETVTEIRPERPRKDPLVLNFAGKATTLLDTRFRFDIDDDGNLDALPMLASGSGFLVFDRNGNGLADSGLELFGPRADDGFGELETLDQDGNGWIDEADAAFSHLGVWHPAGAGTARVVPLADLGIGALGLARIATPFSLRGANNDVLGEVRETGVALGEHGQAYVLQEIVLDRGS